MPWYHSQLRRGFYFLFLVLCVCVLPLTYEPANAQSTRIPRPTGVVSTTATRTVTGAIPLLSFSTPPPVRSEEPLTSGYRNIPPVFDGIDTYHTIQATVTFTDRVGTVATRPLDAIGAVVQILRCDGFGCDTPVGSGVIVHPSGLILTAYHILLENPNDLTSGRYQEFVIALTESVRTSPRPLYRASVVADKNEQDIALLAIDRTFDGEVIAPGTLALPALPFADVDLLFADTLTVLGYPLDGGDAVSNFPATFTGFDDNGRLIVVDRPLSQGNSGGPALALQDGRMAIAGLVIRGRSTQGRLEGEGLLRAIDQVATLNWTTDFARAMGHQINIVERTAAGEQQLQISIDLSTFDLVDANLRLLFYVTDETGQPWQRPGTAGPLVLWANVRPNQVIETQTIDLTVPIAELGQSPDRLRFQGLLWDLDNLLSLWASTAGVQIDLADPLAVQATTPMPVTVAPPPQPPMTPTIDQPATADAIETAVAATLAALNTPTPTVDLIAARLTEIARTTATARALVPTPTPRPTATKMPTRTPTPEVPKPGEAREFGGIRFVYVPAGTFIMGSKDGASDERPQSTIDVDSFWIMESEVTNAQYRAYVEATNASEPVCSDDSKIWSNAAFNGDQQPVVCISWHDAVAYAAWLSAQTGLQIRLPTEAEWEKAARGDDGRQYPWGDDEPTVDLLNYGETVGKTTDVGTYPVGKSPYNALDMAGNVWEWTSTIYDTDRFPYPYNVDDREAPTGDERLVVRGGAWYDPPNFARAAARGNLLPDVRDSNIGLRLLVAVRPTEVVSLFVPTLIPTVTAPLPTGTAEPQKTNTPSASTLEILAVSLNVRNGPGTNYSVKSSVSRGQTFTIVGQAYDCGWFEIRYVNSQTGWISGSNELVSFTGRCSNIDVSTIPSTPTPTPTLEAPTSGAAREFGGIRFVYVPTGPFIMGSTSQQVDAALDLCNRYSGDLNNCQRSEFVDEQPQSTLDTNAFWIMETEVTNVQFAAFIDANGYDQQQYWTAASWAWRTENNIAEPRYWGDPDWNQPDYPIVGISWYEAIAYSAWLAEQSGLAMRLPTEGEWEKASRGEDGRQYPWGNDWDGSKLNFCDSNCEFAWKDQESNDGFATTAPVKSYSTGKGPYNAYGMAGNVWEWTTTIYDTARYPYPYQADDRELLDGGARRVLRGGSWSSQPFSVRAANRPSRGGYMPDGRYFDVGVRLVVSPSN